jgi:hypothetical protein
MSVPNGYAYRFPTFQPAMRLVTAITRAFPAQVTTSFEHDYLTGLIVRLVVPDGYGMVQANGLIGTIEVNSTTTFLIDIDTSYFDPFVIPPDPSPMVITVAQVIPVGEVNSQLIQATRNVL